MTLGGVVTHKSSLVPRLRYAVKKAGGGKRGNLWNLFRNSVGFRGRDVTGKTVDDESRNEMWRAEGKGEGSGT